MRIRIAHATTYRYETPVNGLTQTLRLTPRNYDGQHVVNWRIDLSDDCLRHQQEDAFGNITHTFTADGPILEFNVGVEGLIETQDTHGVVTGAPERLPPGLFLRDTVLTTPDPAIAAFAEASRAAAGAKAEPLTVMHRLLNDLHREIKFDADPTHSATTAAESFAMRRGVCQDISHIYIAAARHLGHPARYIGGYFHRADGVTAQDAGHAWTEVYIEPLGWVAFDPTNGISATGAHIRVAAGLDYLGAAPVRGTRFGGGGETLTVAVTVAQAQQ